MQLHLSRLPVPAEFSKYLLDYILFSNILNTQRPQLFESALEADTAVYLSQREADLQQRSKYAPNPF